MSDLNIYQRINEVRKKVDYLKKDAKVQNYKGVKHDTVTAFIRDHLIDEGIVIIPSEISSATVSTGTVTNNGTPIIRFEAKYCITYVNIDSPDDKISMELTAHANDTGDKAPGKAVSYATKAAELKMFNIETGESDESRVEGTLPYTSEQKEKFYTLFEEGNDVEFYAFNRFLSTEASIGLHNSFPKGEKTKNKEKTRKLEAEGVKKIVSYSEQLTKAAEKEDEHSVEQLKNEMSYDVQKAVTELLSEPTKEKLTAMRGSK